MLRKQLVQAAVLSLERVVRHSVRSYGVADAGDVQIVAVAVHRCALTMELAQKCCVELFADQTTVIDTHLLSRIDGVLCAIVQLTAVEQYVAVFGVVVLDCTNDL